MEELSSTNAQRECESPPKAILRHQQSRRAAPLFNQTMTFQRESDPEDIHSKIPIVLSMHSRLNEFHKSLVCKLEKTIGS